MYACRQTDRNAEQTVCMSVCLLLCLYIYLSASFSVCVRTLSTNQLMTISNRCLLVLAPFDGFLTDNITDTNTYIHTYIQGFFVTKWVPVRTIRSIQTFGAENCFKTSISGKNFTCQLLKKLMTFLLFH